MNEFVIYHNPKCSKSRQTLELLHEHSIKPRIIEYLQQPLSQDELKQLLKKLGKSAGEILRAKENIVAELALDLSSAEAILKAIASHPILMERPIVVYGLRAVIGRPPENVLELIKKD